MRCLIAALAIFTCLSSAVAAPRVVASIMPIHAIVAAVMGDTGTPELLFSGTMSEHSASLTPQQIASLGSADLVFMTGPAIEVRLGQINGSEAVNGKTFIMLADAPGLKRLKTREGGAWETHGHEVDSGENHQEGVVTFNSHVWLSPANAKAMATEVARQLASADSANAVTYRANAESFAAEVDRATAEIAALLSPMKDKPFIVFHDAYPYFEDAFGLSAVGSISDPSGSPPSAKRLGEIRDKLAEAQAVCVFREPQFDARYAETVIDGTEARLGILDAVGADLTPGPSAYVEMLQNLARNAEACLSGRN